MSLSVLHNAFRIIADLHNTKLAECEEELRRNLTWVGESFGTSSVASFSSVSSITHISTEASSSSAIENSNANECVEKVEKGRGKRTSPAEDISSKNKRQKRNHIKKPKVIKKIENTDSIIIESSTETESKCCEPFDIKTLDKMKRRGLQELCKKFKIKANSKTVVLLSALKKFHESQQQKYKSSDNQKNPDNMDIDSTEKIIPNDELSVKIANGEDNEESEVVDLVPSEVSSEENTVTTEDDNKLLLLDVISVAASMASAANLVAVDSYNVANAVLVSLLVAEAAVASAGAVVAANDTVSVMDNIVRKCVSSIAVRNAALISLSSSLAAKKSVELAVNFVNERIKAKEDQKKAMEIAARLEEQKQEKIRKAKLEEEQKRRAVEEEKRLFEANEKKRKLQEKEQKLLAIQQKSKEMASRIEIDTKIHMEIDKKSDPTPMIMASKAAATPSSLRDLWGAPSSSSSTENSSSLCSAPSSGLTSGVPASAYMSGKSTSLIRGHVTTSATTGSSLKEQRLKEEKLKLKLKLREKAQATARKRALQERTGEKSSHSGSKSTITGRSVPPLNRTSATSMNRTSTTSIMNASATSSNRTSAIALPPASTSSSTSALGTSTVSKTQSVLDSLPNTDKSLCSNKSDILLKRDVFTEKRDMEAKRSKDEEIQRQKQKEKYMNESKVKKAEGLKRRKQALEELENKRKADLEAKRLAKEKRHLLAQQKRKEEERMKLQEKKRREQKKNDERRKARLAYEQKKNDRSKTSHIKNVQKMGRIVGVSSSVTNASTQATKKSNMRKKTNEKMQNETKIISNSKVKQTKESEMLGHEKQMRHQEMKIERENVQNNYDMSDADESESESTFSL